MEKENITLGTERCENIDTLYTLYVYVYIFFDITFFLECILKKKESLRGSEFIRLRIGTIEEPL